MKICRCAYSPPSRRHHGPFMVKENGEFENMVEDIELFDSPPLLKDLVDRVVSKHSCGIDEISLGQI